jgi:nucleotide-binding universal stress UspA family protein
VFFETASSSLSAFVDSSDDGRPILVATDGHAHADTAMIAAAFLAGRSGQNVQVFSAVEGVALPCQRCQERSGAAQSQGKAVKPCRTQIALQHALAQRRTAIETQVALTVGEAAEWPITVQAGTLSDVSRDLIAHLNAQLLVVGQCRQRRLDAPPGSCEATEQLIHSSIPIYIAAPTLRGLARRIVIAMDFSETSMRAAYLATRFSARDASLYLVHVLPHAAASELEERRHHLLRVAQSVRSGTECRVESVLLLGAAAPETLGFADGIQADVIACGASSLPAYPVSRPSSPSLGRVARDLIRRVSCSLLIAPELAVVVK